MATEKQLKTLAKIFKRSGRTFQALARECDLKYIPDHVNELTTAQAKTLITRSGMFLMGGTKSKQ